MLVAGTTRKFRALQIAAGSDPAYWTLVDDDYNLVPLAHDYLRDLRVGQGRSLSTTKTYAECLALYFEWLQLMDLALEDGPRHLGKFIHWLKTSPIRRQGAGVGRPRENGRIATILTTVRSLYKHAVATRLVEPDILARLYVMSDDRTYPLEAKLEGGLVSAVLRPVHRVRVTHRASVDDAKPDEVIALLEACRHWRDRCLISVLGMAGLRDGEALGLRLSDLHLAETSHTLGCSYPGPHLHVVPRENANGARAKSGRRRIVPLAAPLVGAFDHYFRDERDRCAAARNCDFVFVNLWSEPLGAPMKPSRVAKLLRGLSHRAQLDRRIHPHMLRHTAGSGFAEAQGVDTARLLLGQASLSSTEIYLHPSEERQREAVRRLASSFDGAQTRESS